MTTKVYLLYDRDNDDYLGVYETNDLAKEARMSYAKSMVEQFGDELGVWLQDLIILEIDYKEKKDR